MNPAHVFLPEKILSGGKVVWDLRTALASDVVRHLLARLSVGADVLNAQIAALRENSENLHRLVSPST